MSNYTKGKSAGKGWIVRCLGILLHRYETEHEADLSIALHDCANELQRLRSVHLPRYEDKIGEPDLSVLERARDTLDLRDV
jgi:hypothetical protein